MAEADIARNIALVRERIAQAAARAGRSEADITLVAVTKTVPAERIAQAMAAGARDFGENYVQEALAKIGHPLLDQSDIRWHFIGHLQSNKAKEVVRNFAMVQSVDSVALAKEIGKRAQQIGKIASILLEIKLDTTTEEKFGLAPETALATAAEINGLSGVQVRGLMGMAPFSPNAEDARPHFRRLRTLFQQLPLPMRQTLSMGMSGDFEVAIEEGATLVRIGTAIFGKRD